MRMRKQMVLTIFFVTGTLAAVTELQFRIRKLRSSTDHAFVLRNAGSRTRIRKLSTEFPLSLLLFARNMRLGRPEEQEHIRHRKNNL